MLVISLPPDLLQTGPDRLGSIEWKYRYFASGTCSRVKINNSPICRSRSRRIETGIPGKNGGTKNFLATKVWYKTTSNFGRKGASCQSERVLINGYFVIWKKSQTMFSTTLWKQSANNLLFTNYKLRSEKWCLSKRSFEHFKRFLERQQTQQDLR